MNALNWQSLLREAFAEGATDFVCKPFDGNDLIAIFDESVPELDIPE